MLKPSEMGVTGIKRTIKAHKELVERKLKNLPNKKLAKACYEVMEASPGDKINVADLKANEMNMIKNYFAEVSGPIWVQEKQLLSGIKPSDHTFFSNSDTERLYDFIIYKNQNPILISNKQKSGGTNTLKPGDVVTLVDKDKILINKWKNTKYYKIFKMLDEKNVISGPISVIAKFYPNAVDVGGPEYIKVISQMVQNDVIIQDTPKAIMQLIKNDESARNKLMETGQVSGTMVNFIFEKILIQKSIEDSKYDELFLDVTKGNISFLKFDLSSKGVVQYLIENPKTRAKKAKLRSKQGVERRSSSGRLKLDKLGFQP